MVIVKCKECGQEYELEDGNNPSDFQCDKCEGALKYVPIVKQEKFKKNCPNCGTRNIKGAMFCEECGESLKQITKPRVSKDITKGKGISTNLKIILDSIGVLFLGLIIIIGIGGMLYPHTISNESKIDDSGSKTNAGTGPNTYNGALMSFEYPNGYTLTEKSGGGVELRKGDFDWVQVILVGTASENDGLNKYMDEGIALGEMYESKGWYTDSVANVKYQVFTGKFNNTSIPIGILFSISY